MAQVKYFYIGDRQVFIEISPQLASTLDESLDNLNVNEELNDIEEPYKPFTRFYIKDENYNTIQTFIISNDNVELVTINPNRYKHKLSLVQESEFLTKHEIRNTVFSSEQDNQITKYVSASVYAKNMKDEYVEGEVLQVLFYGENVFDYLSNKVNATIDLSKKSIRNASFKIRFNYQAMLSHGSGSGAHSITCEYRAPSKWADIYAESLVHPTITEYPTIKFTIGNDSRSLTLSNDDYSNGDVVNIPNSIIAWIQSFSTGTLTISIENAQFQDTFMYSNAFDNLRVQEGNPWFVNISYIFNFELGSRDYNIYSVIDTLLKQQMKETEYYNSSNDSANIKPLFLMPTQSHNPDLYNLLKETQVPNLIFTQCSIYDALVEIFKLFDAIFTIDNDGYLDIEYFNEAAQSRINKPSIAGKSSALSEERFTNKLITYFQNTKINNKFPNSNNEDSLAYLRSKSLGVPNESDYVFVVPKPIDIIKSVRVKAPIKFNDNLSLRYSGTVHNIYFGNPTETEPLDITPFVIEESIWTILPNGQPPINGDWSIAGKYNSLNYKRGSNYIDVSGYQTTVLNKKTQTLNWLLKSVINCLYGIGTTQNENLVQDTTINWRDVSMQVEYIALVDGKLVNESIDYKYNGETLINQSNGSIDINKLGLNMVGLNLKLGQPTLNMTQEFSSWNNRVKKGQYFIDDNGDRWVANTCVYTVIKPDLIQTNIEFVKNFNGLAKRIELNSEKRLSNISNELTTKCEETYGEYIYYSSKEISDSGEFISLYYYVVESSIAASFNADYDIIQDLPIRIEYAVVTAYDERNNTITLDETGEVANISIPLMVYGSGNSICFEMSYDSPISAGNQLLDNYTSNLWDGGWFSRAVLYTDQEGNADNFNIEFIKAEEELTRYYPAMKKTDNSYINMSSLGLISHFKYYKKSNEIFALNYQLHFLPKNKNIDFLSNEFIKNNYFANGLNNQQFYIVASTSEDDIYSILDTKGIGDTLYQIESTNIIHNGSSLITAPTDLRIIFSASVPNWSSIKSWAIVDKNNNIYFASNSSPIQNPDLTINEFAIYFKSRHHRLS